MSSNRSASKSRDASNSSGQKKIGTNVTPGVPATARPRRLQQQGAFNSRAPSTTGRLQQQGKNQFQRR